MDELEEMRDRIAVYRERIDRIVSRRDNMIRERLMKGDRPVDLMRLAGVNRARIYQIKNARVSSA